MARNMKNLEGTLSSVVIHVVRLRHAGEQYKRRNGRRQTKEITVLNDVSPLLVFYQCIPYSSAWWFSTT